MGCMPLTPTLWKQRQAGLVSSRTVWSIYLASSRLASATQVLSQESKTKEGISRYFLTVSGSQGFACSGVSDLDLTGPTLVSSEIWASCPLEGTPAGVDRRQYYVHGYGVCYLTLQLLVLELLVCKSAEQTGWAEPGPLILLPRGPCGM